ncbi:MAG TPA: GAF domain-containing protein [Acidothermaceae bacterium]|nr:GAF domain-containing protein [Acidothermaceae bacterium]
MRTVIAQTVRSGQRGAPAANQLCLACLPLLGVDSAALSLVDDGESRGTFGASTDHARLLDALHFTTGEGPCLQAAHTGNPVLVPDLHAYHELRWPAFQDSAERAGIRAVFAIPVRTGRITFGALDLFRSTPGPLTMTQLADAVLVANAAAQILLAVVIDSADQPYRPSSAQQWEQAASMERIEIYQATGMIMAQLKLSAALALLRLRAHAFAHDQTANEVAQQIVSRQLRMEP